VLFPEGKNNPGNLGLNPEEETIAELLKGKEYATTVAGKWHLGDKKMFLPTQEKMGKMGKRKHLSKPKPFTIWRKIF